MRENGEYRHNKETPYHISAGGVVFDRKKDGEIEVVLLGRYDGNKKRYHLPKGTLHHDETLEDCARREVREESGYEAEIKGLLGGLNQKYVARDGLAVEKMTVYFAMSLIRRMGEHDKEHDFVIRMGIDEAMRELEATEPKKQEYEIVKRLKIFLKKND